jgi:hypothetical protein
MNKKDTLKLNNIKKSLGVTTKAENFLVEYLFERDLNRSILLYSYGTIKEIDGWIHVNATTNKHSFSFSVLASKLEKGDTHELWRKID